MQAPRLRSFSALRHRQESKGEASEHLESSPFLNTLSVLRTYYNIGIQSTTNPKTAQVVYGGYGESFSASDLAAFQAYYNVPSTPITGTSDESLCNTTTTGNCNEGNLDVQYITGIAANTKTYFINGASSSATTFKYWLANLVNLPILPRVASISYGAAELDLSPTELSLFDNEAIKLSAMGVTIVASSGDDGANSDQVEQSSAYCGYVVNFPASSAYVLGVGATSGPGILDLTSTILSKNVISSVFYRHKHAGGGL